MKTTELISTIVIVAVIVVYFKFKRKKQKESSWKGKLLKKRIICDEDGDEVYYRLFFKTDNGKKVKVNVSKEIYNKAEVSDRYEKVKGDHIPKKIS